MNPAIWRFMPIGILLSVLIPVFACADVGPGRKALGEVVKLPPPRLDSEVSLEETLSLRRSVRSFTSKELTLAEISQLCWAAQGITQESRGFRTAPSAGALYPLELYLATPAGAFRYMPASHSLKVVSEADLRGGLGDAALRQGSVYAGTCVFVITAVYERTSKKYGGRAAQYVHIEVGHAGENLMLQAVALKLGGVAIGAFDDKKVAQALGLPDDHAPLLIIPVGHPR